MSEKRVALLIATDNYDQAGLTQLKSPAKDAEALADTLRDPRLGNFQVEVLRNAKSADICAQVDDLLSERDPSDLVLLHFSCHGIKDDSGQLYLAAVNTVLGRLDTTAVDSALIDRLMRRSRARRIVLFLDCCYGGAFERGVLARASGTVNVGERFTQSALERGRGRVVITASATEEFAFEGSTLSDVSENAPSFFTGALIKGIRTGAADRDLDGHVTLSELYEYLYEEVRSRTPNQTPAKWEFGVQGDLHIARNPFRVITPSRVPDETMELIYNERASVRLIAVKELGRMLEGANLPVAAAARAELEKLKGDDSRMVAAAAKEQLQRSTLTLLTDAIDLGLVSLPPSGPVRSSVEVSGVPLALSSAVSSSVPELVASLDGNTLSIEWNPAGPGPLEATVRVSGPAGEAEVVVRGQADAVPEPPPSPTRADPPEPPESPENAAVPDAPEPEPASTAGEPYVAGWSSLAIVTAVVAFGLTIYLQVRDQLGRRHADQLALAVVVIGLLAGAVVYVRNAPPAPRSPLSMRTARPLLLRAVPLVLVVAACSYGGARGALLTPALRGAPCSEEAPGKYLHGTVDVGIDGQTPGWSYGTPPQGFDVDLVNFIAQEEGFTPHFVSVLPKNREKVLENCTVRLVVANYSIIPARRKLVGFAGPYFLDQSGIQWLSSKLTPEEKKTNLFNGSKVCVAQGTTAQSYLEPDGSKPVVEDSVKDCLKRLFDANDRAVEAVVTDQSMLAGYQALNTSSAVGQVSWDHQSDPINHESYGIGIPLHHQDVCRRLDSDITKFLAQNWSTAFSVNMPGGYSADRHKPSAVDPANCNPPILRS